MVLFYKGLSFGMLICNLEILIIFRNLECFFTKNVFLKKLLFSQFPHPKAAVDTLRTKERDVVQRLFEPSGFHSTFPHAPMLGEEEFLSGLESSAYVSVECGNGLLCNARRYLQENGVCVCVCVCVCVLIMHRVYVLFYVNKTVFPTSTELFGAVNLCL